MTKEQAQFIEQILDNGRNEVSVRDDYSGRGMYGESTCAVVTDASEIDLFCALANFAREEDTYDEIPEFKRLRTDSMGRDSIVIY